MKQSKILKLILGGVFVLFLFSILNVELTSAQSECLDKLTGVDRYNSCRVNAGESLFIPTEGCSIPFIQINNSTNKDLFIPTKDCTEFNSVVVHLPTNTSASTSSGLSCGDNLIDSRDGQSYSTKLFDNQCWMTKNLNYVLNDGTGSWCYDNNTANCNTYGRLYNWSTATSACPPGWRLPSDAEFFALKGNIGSEVSQWVNTSGWHGVYGGFRETNGNFPSKTDGYYWCSSLSSNGPLGWWLRSEYLWVVRYQYDQGRGYSVRCLKDGPVIKNGNFESGNLSWWNVQGNASVDGSYKKSGNYGARVRSDTISGNWNSYIQKTIDLTGKDYLRFYYKYSYSTGSVGRGDGSISVLLMPDQIPLQNFGGTGINYTSPWIEKIIDVSSFSGEELLRLGATAGSQSGGSMTIDFIIDDIELLNRASPTISLSGATKTYGDSAFTITHSTNSTGAKSFSSSNTSVATINSSGVVTITGAGTTTITFNVGSSANYNASSATATLTVNKATPTCSISPTTKTYGNAAYTVTNSTTSNGTKSFSSNNTGVASINNSSTGSITIGNVGSATITMSVAAATNYNATSCTGTQTVNKADQATPAAPTMNSRTTTCIFLNGCSGGGCEFRRDGGLWQTATNFCNLTSGTTYSFTQRKAATTNYNASSESSAVNISTVAEWACGTNYFVDGRDGQSYPTKLFGSQCWMTKNLNYNIATSYCYGNNTTLCNTYGRLYTQTTAATACPTGWHLASDAEYTALEGVIGSAKTAWMDAGVWAGLYGGAYYSNAFRYAGSYGFWWTSTPYSSNYWARVLYSATNVYRASYPAGNNAFSVRCVKD